MTHWAKSKEFSTGYFRLWILLKIYKIFGRKVLKIVIFPIVLIAFFFMKKVRISSRAYFKILYEYTQNKKYKPSLLNTFKHIYSFAESMIDKLAGWCGDIRKKDLHFLTPDEQEKFLASLEAKKGFFVLCSHLGNVEILRAMATDKKNGISVNAFIEVSQTKGFNDFIAKVNPNSSLNLYSTRNIGIETAFEIKQKIDDGEICVMAGDRTAIANEKEYVTRKFLGRDAAFPKGAFRFAKIMECNFCFLAICEKNGKYDVSLKIYNMDEINNQEQIINDYVDWLETLILKYPYQWYNFYNFWNLGEETL